MEHAMDVKWERRGPEGGGRRARHHLHAILVERQREKGALNERVIRHLASIEERFLETKEIGMKAFHQGLFWAVADKKLSDLRLAGDVRKKIEGEISEVVPRPSSEWGLWAVTCVPNYES
jgi:hypothetical protein